MDEYEDRDDIDDHGGYKGKIIVDQSTYKEL